MSAICDTCGCCPNVVSFPQVAASCQHHARVPMIWFAPAKVLQQGLQTYRAPVTPCLQSDFKRSKIAKDCFTEFAMATSLQLKRVLPYALSSAPPAWSAGLRRLFAVSPVVDYTWPVSYRMASRTSAEYRTPACSRSAAVAGSPVHTLRVVHAPPRRTAPSATPSRWKCHYM